MDEHTHGLANRLSKNERLVLFAATVAMGLAALDIDVPAAAMPRIAAQLHGIPLIGYTFTLYLVSMVLAMPLSGRLSDQFGRKPLLIGGIAIFLGGSILAACAQNMWMFLLARAIQGIGAGPLPPLAMTLAADFITDTGRLGKVQSRMNSVYAISTLLGPIVGGTIADAVSWRGIFLLNVPIGLFALTILGSYLPVARPDTSRESGSATRQEQAISWYSPVILFGYSASLLFGAVIFLLYAYIPLHAQALAGQGVRASGLLIAPLALSWTASQLVVGNLMERFDRPAIHCTLMVIGSCLLLVAWTGLLLVLLAGAPFFLMAIAVLLLGVGGGFLNAPLTPIIQNSVPPSRLGLASALVETFYSLGNAGGVLVAGLIFQASLGNAGGSTSSILLDATQHGPLSLQERDQLIAQFAASLRDVYLFAIFLALALTCVVALLTLVYVGQRRQTAQESLPKTITAMPETVDVEGR
jgi:MFS family permease